MKIVPPAVRRRGRRVGGGIFFWGGKIVINFFSGKSSYAICPLRTQSPRMRQFCVEIAPPYNWRNIDAALLREHSVRRICAHYKILHICANLTHASMHALNLRKKTAKKIGACAKKSKKKLRLAGFEPGTFHFLRHRLIHSATLLSC